MLHYWSLQDVNLKSSWLTIGSFDGVHLGHQEIVGKLTAGAHASGVPAVVLTFYPHPAVVLGKRNNTFYLTTPEERASLLGNLGVDMVITHPFNREIAELTAYQFMSYLVEHLSPSRLWVGYDFALGRGREGDVTTLQQLGQELGYLVEVMQPVRLEEEVISSSRVRALILEGEVRKAAELLGRPYRVSGRVVPGDGRGRTIGIPTANLSLWEHLVIPKTGVYACKAVVNSQEYGAVTNIGVRPTFKSDSPSPTVEVHILDFDKDLYGNHVHLDFIDRLRGERRFSGVSALVEQIHRDIDITREIL